jgi:predicted nucleic-acid-binding Zn-ribbon protein
MTDNKKCSSCGNVAVYVYTASFRIGGTSGGWKLLLGEWAEIGENMIPMNVYVCQNCGKIELYATEQLIHSQSLN